MAGGLRGRRQADRIVTEHPSNPVGEAPESLYLRCDRGADPAPLLGWLEGTLPALSWRSHLFVLGLPEPPTALVAGVVERAGAFLDRVRFASLAIHPVVDLDHGFRLKGGDLEALLDAARRFQEEAYREQGESRMLIHPILVTCGRAPARRVGEVVAHLQSRLAFPRLMVGGEPEPELLALLDTDQVRLHIEPDGCAASDGVLRQLAAHHVFESLLERREGPGLLEPCRRHLVVDPGRGGVFPCVLAWRLGAGSVPMNLPSPGADQVPIAECAGCMKWSMERARADLERSGRGADCHRIMLRLAMALGERRRFSESAELASQAAGLATAAGDRAAAHLHLGLTLLLQGRLEDADGALRDALADGADPGLIAFHRGRVQMAWPDEIEALERFAEAEAASSDQVPERELHLAMAMCHVNLAEYDEARPHLARADDPGQRAVVEFYRGLCELGEGRPAPALDRFRASMAAGPAPDDLSRVLLYEATSLKELGRYAEAIESLARAAVLEPDELAHHNLLGFCLYKLGRHREAVECFERAVEIDPRSALDWSNLGANLRELGRLDEAESAYGRALDLDPTLALARNGLERVDQLRRGGEPPPTH